MPDPHPSTLRLVNLWQAAALDAQRHWEPFRPGIDISRIYGDGHTGSAAAFLRYQPGASVALHRHVGYEHVLILAGSQTDHNGVHEAGTLVINPPGSHHQVVSAGGCLALVIWEQPVVFVG